jgi:SAM-dependent methyltransferase
MPRTPKPEAYYDSLNKALLQKVPPRARSILDVGCGTGSLGAALKRQDPSRQVFGIERAAGPAGRAARRLDRVFNVHVEEFDPPLERASIDCIVYGNVLEDLTDPEAVVRRHRRFLRSDGLILCCVQNVQHFSLLTSLCTGDFQYTTAGLPDDAHLRFFSRSTFLKLLLDCGYAPSVVHTAARPCPAEWWQAVEPLVRHLRLDPERARRAFSTTQFIFSGTPLPADPPDGDLMPHEVDPRREQALTFVACVSDEGVLRSNLLSSPCLRPGSPHEILLLKGYPNAAVGLNEGIAKAKNDWVVCLYQDVYLPAGWPTRFLTQCRRAAEIHGPVGVCGVLAARGVGADRRILGHVVHQDRLLNAGRLPAAVDTLDELLLALPRGTPLRFDPSLGFHFYGADACLAARRAGLNVVALDALCYHNTRSNGFVPAFYESGEVFARKWSDSLPVATPCATVEPGGKLNVT